jgi:hypothetical protein
VLSNPDFEHRPSRSDVIAAVGTSEDIKIGSIVHGKMLDLETLRKTRAHGELIDKFVNLDVAVSSFETRPRGRSSSDNGEAVARG